MLLRIVGALIILSLVSPILGIAQNVHYEEIIKTKPVAYEKLHLEALIGVGVSKLPIRPARLTTTALPTLYGEVGLIIPVAPRWRIRSSINYQVIGNSLKYRAPAPQVGTATANRKLIYFSTQVQAGYLLSKLTDRIQVELQAGFFAAKQLDDLTVNRIPGQGVNREKSTDSSVGYNYGLVSGLGVSTLINQHHRLGLRLLYHQGIFDIRTTVAKQNTGELPIITQAFSFCTFFSI